MSAPDYQFERRIKAWKREVSDAGLLYEARSRRYFKPKRERLIAKRHRGRRLAAKARR